MFKAVTIVYGTCKIGSSFGNAWIVYTVNLAGQLFSELRLGKVPGWTVFLPSPDLEKLLHSYGFCSVISLRNRKFYEG